MPRQPRLDAPGLISFLAARSMGYKFTDIAEILGIHPVTAGRCAEKGRKLILCRLPRRWEPSYWGEICFCFYFTGMTTMREFGICWRIAVR